MKQKSKWELMKAKYEALDALTKFLISLVTLSGAIAAVAKACLIFFN